MSRWTSYLVSSLVVAGLAAAFVPSVVAAPKMPGAKAKPSKPLPTDKAQVVGPAFSVKAKLRPQDLIRDVASASSVQFKATPTPRIQEIVAERSENAILARGVGKRLVVSPRTMFIDKYTHMQAVGDIEVNPLFRDTGRITMKRKSEWIHNQGMTDYVAIGFRAAADKHYVIDCLVMGDQAELYLSHHNDWIGGKATHDGDHRIAHLPKASKLRDVSAFVFNEPEHGAWAELYQCEIIPLRE